VTRVGAATVVLALAGLAAGGRVGRVAAQAPMQDAQAARLLGEARAALGGPSLARVENLWLTGDERVILEYGTGPEFPAKLDLRLVLPDTYLWTRMFFGITSTSGILRGERYLRTTGRGVVPSPPRQDEAARTGRERSLRLMRHEAARLLLGLLLSDRLPLPVTVAYGGWAESRDGRAEVLVVTGPDDFAARLFLDEASRRPLLMTFDELEPPRRIGEREWKRVAKALYFEEPRRVDGVWLPQRVVQTLDGRVDREWRFTTMRVNARGLLDIVEK
jgi:hypothetical protein